MSKIPDDHPAWDDYPKSNYAEWGCKYCGSGMTCGCWEVMGIDDDYCHACEDRGYVFSHVDANGNDVYQDCKCVQQ